MVKRIIDEDLKGKAISWIMAKGLGVTVLVIWLTTLNMEVRELRANMDALQNNTIRENTRVLYEFNLKHNTGLHLPDKLPYNDDKTID